VTSSFPAFIAGYRSNGLHPGTVCPSKSAHQSERLRAAEQQRLGVASPEKGDDDVTIDLTTSGAAVIDLTARRQQAGHGSRSPGDALRPYPFDATSDSNVWAAGAEGISYNPVRDGDATSAFGEPSPLMADRSSNTPCPRCGGLTQIDLYDQVHQTTSLSCLSCFHMFRVHA
jgi:hypothetical protein